MEYEGKFGIIDSFRHRTQVPALQLLQKLGASRLEFLGLTHPHEDHYGGLGEIFDTFWALGGVGEFWKYPVLDWRRLYKILQLRAQKTSISPAVYAAKIANLTELQKFYDRLFELKDDLAFRHMELGMSRRLTPDTQACVIAPAGQIRLEADERLANELENAENKQEPLNDYSFGLHVRVKSHSVYLTGDVTGRSWAIAATDPLWPEVTEPGESVFLKLAHHGSSNDNPEWLLDRLKGRAPNSFGVTRYRSSALPRQEVIDRVQLRGRLVRLSDYPDPNNTSTLEPECLQLTFSDSGVDFQRKSLAEMLR